MPFPKRDKGQKGQRSRMVLRGVILLEILDKLKTAINKNPSSNSMTILNSMVDAYDDGLHKHMVETGTMTLSIWSGLGLDNGIDPYYAGYLHDLGKLALSREMFWKPKRLTENEWEQMKTHPVVGANILMSTPDLCQYVEVVLCHHEKPEGNGYPRGLKDRDIPLLAKIISVADMFCSMRSFRSYRPAYNFEQTIIRIEKEWKRGFSEDVFTKIKDILFTDSR